jgi:hypothetical protein
MEYWSDRFNSGHWPGLEVGGLSRNHSGLEVRGQKSFALRLRPFVPQDKPSDPKIMSEALPTSSSPLMGEVRSG